jgi:hypothetical protein
MANSPAAKAAGASSSVASGGATTDPHHGGGGSGSWPAPAAVAADGALAAVVADGSVAEAVADAPPASGDGLAKISTVRRRAPKLTIAEPRREPVVDDGPKAARLRVGRVRLWSVARVAFVLNLSFFIVFMVATVSLWMVAATTGTVHQVEHWVASTLLVKSFHLRAQPLLQVTAGIGGLAVVVGTFAAVILGALYNLIADVVGGVEVEVVDRRRPERHS